MIKHISFHNGSGYVRKHNNRQLKDLKNVDYTKTYNNIILKDEPLKIAYKKCFSEAVKEYNSKQTREDRKIKNYLSKIKQDKTKHTVYECIVQIGDCKSVGIDSKEAGLCECALIEFCNEWKKRNPHLYIVQSVIHCDEPEGTVHAHIAYIPIATGYKRGLKVQNGLNKALQQQGFQMQTKAQGQWKTPQIQWEESERQALLEIAKSYGIEEVTNQHDSNQKRKHESTQAYKFNKDKDMKEYLEAQADLDNIEKLKHAAQKQISEFLSWKKKNQKLIDELKPVLEEFQEFASMAEQEISNRLMQEVMQQLNSIEKPPEACFNDFIEPEL